MPTQFPQITDPVFRQALAIPPVGIAEQIEHVVHTTVTRLQTLVGDRYEVTLKAPDIKYDLKGRVSGRAWYAAPNTKRPQGINHVRLNNALLYDERAVDEMLSQTVPHEVAHIVQRQIWPKSKSHGYEWQYLMKLLELEPRRCHTYEVTSARNRSKLARPYIYVCNSCGHEFHLTQILHRRIQQGQIRICKQCNTRLVYVETRLDHTTVPQQG